MTLLGFTPARRPSPVRHACLEVFILMSETCRLQMGDGVVTLARGDVFVTDPEQPHAVLDFPGDRAEALVIRFLPEVVRSPGSAAADHLMLLPFYCPCPEQPHVLRAHDAAADAVHATLAEMVANWTDVERGAYGQAGARAHFLVVLHQLARHFQAAERLTELYARQQTRRGRLRRVFDFLERHYADRIALPEIAAMARLSRPQFHAVFKKATGMTLVDYVNRVRLTRAARLLQETALPVVEIAHAVGFADQSYFDRRFRRHFGRTPRQFRSGTAMAAGAGG